MRMATLRSLVSPVSAALIALLLGVSFVSFPGCGTVPTARREAKILYEGSGNHTSSYQKTMVALPFENNVEWAPASLGATFTPLLKDAILQEGHRVRLLLPDDPDFPADFNNPPYLATGNPDGYKLAAIGRDAGTNLVLSAKLADIRHETEDRGMFWFAEVVHVARIQMQILVYHTGTGARLLDRSIFYSIDISEASGRRIDAGEMPDSLQFTDALADIAETMGKLTGNILKYTPWEGYVSRVEGNRIVLTAGEASGLKKGRHLAVYDTVETTGDDGLQQFSAPGDMIGTITITAVYPDHCEAVADEGGPFGPGNVVKSR